MAEPWKKWKKPWTRTQCGKRYIEGDRISTRALAEISGVHQKQLESWCTEDSWRSQRGKFQGKLQEKTQEKTLEKTSDRLSDEYSEITVTHCNALKKCREVATLMVGLYLEEWEQLLKEAGESDRQEARQKILKTNTRDIDYLSQVIERSIRAERDALGLEFEEINKALAVVQRAGFKVVSPDADSSGETGGDPPDPSKENREAESISVVTVEAIATPETA